MLTGLLHTHKLVVLLFLVHYIVKLVLLLMNRNEQLAKYTKVTKVPEMIISALFLITGVWMIVAGSLLTTLLVIKIVCVLASIPLAIIGFKKNNKVLAFVAVALIVSAYGMAEANKKKKGGTAIDTSSISDPLVVGKTVYDNNCKKCHGDDGKLGVSGAKDLSATQLPAQDQKTLIREGKSFMPAYKQLTDEQVDAVTQYVATLKH